MIKLQQQCLQLQAPSKKVEINVKIVRWHIYPSNIEQRTGDEANHDTFGDWSGDFTELENKSRVWTPGLQIWNFMEQLRDIGSVFVSDGFWLGGCSWRWMWHQCSE